MKRVGGITIYYIAISFRFIVNLFHVLFKIPCNTNLSDCDQLISLD